MVAWSLHRVTGLGVFLFLLAHVVDTSLVALGPDAYNHALALYRHPIFRVGEVALVACVLYHAINGVRIVLVDLSERAAQHQRGLFWAGLALFAVTFLPTAFLMLRPV